MAIYALTGNDSLILNDRVIKELSDGSTIEVSYQNDRIGMSTGKNNNTVIAENRQGLNASLTLRVVRGGADDRWLNGLSIQQDKDLPSFNLINGSFTKRIGNGQGRPPILIDPDTQDRLALRKLFPDGGRKQRPVIAQLSRHRLPFFDEILIRKNLVGHVNIPVLSLH